jgi:hypothetical protein
MTKKELYAHPGWKSCTFEGAEMSTLLPGLQTTFREKLQWLEEAETLALRMRDKKSKMANAEGGKRKAKSGKRETETPRTKAEIRNLNQTQKNQS